ncbi:hypothetical protein ACJIZ3_013121 [Penstemon smallii]|uniref:Phytocyanin domain-containing protein n=1 Tax=Penstemon smallii TaxID=265156 RepID=A0ABD3UNZ0_9LAMI
MARLNQNAVCALALLSVLFLIQKGNAYEFKVGGSKATWAVPSDPNASIYNQWAENSRFQIGDTLLFVYAPDKDSVLHVTKDDYTNCNTKSPLEKFSDGHTVFSLNQSGPHYFISGVTENCLKNEKVVVIVMADRSKRASPPSPSAEVPPPSPAPAGQESPPPPPPQAEEMNPTPAPSQESSPPKTKNGASSTVNGFVGTVAAFFGSVLVLAI